MNMFNSLKEVLMGDLAQSVKDFRLNLITECGAAGESLWLGARLIAHVDEVNEVLFPVGSTVLVSNIQIGQIEELDGPRALVNGQWFAYKNLTIVKAKDIEVLSINKTGFNCSVGHIKTDKLSEVLQVMSADRCVTIYKEENTWNLL